MATTNLEIPELASNQAQPDVTHNEALEWLDWAVSGQGTFESAADQDYDLELLEPSGRKPYIYMWLVLQDTGGYLTQPRKILFPDGTDRRMILDNRSAFTLDAQCKAGGNVVSISPGTKVEVLSDGTNVTEIAFGVPEPVRGYGGITEPAISSTFTIGATPLTLNASEGVYTTPVNVIQDTANDGIIVTLAGVWRYSFEVSFDFTSTASGRTLELRLWNVTDGTPSGSKAIFVGRDQEGVNISGDIPVEITAAGVNDVLAIQVFSSTDTFTNVRRLSYRFDVTREDAT